MLSDAHYAAIGRVAVAASEVEHLVITMLVLKRGNKGDQSAMASKNNSSWRKELRGLASADLTQQGPDIINWLDDVERLLDGRHELMHARWFRDGNSAIRSPIGMRGRRDEASGAGQLQPVVVSLPAWMQLATALEQAGQHVRPLAREEMRRCGLV